MNTEFSHNDESGGRITSVDGRFFFSRSASGIVRLWDFGEGGVRLLGVEEVVEAARTAAGRVLSDAERTEYAIDAPASSTRRAWTLRDLSNDPTDDWKMALDHQVDLECDGAPLADVVDGLGKTFALAAVLDHDALAVVNVAFDAPITATQKDTTLRSALNVALGPLGLGFEFRGHVLAITKSLPEP